MESNQTRLKTLSTTRDSAWRIVGIYALFASLWIVLSDSVVAQLFANDMATVSLVSTAKGWFFVAVTSALLFVLISRLIRNYERTLHTVSQREAELQEAGQLLLEAQQTAGLGSYELDIASGRWRSSGICDQVLGIDEKFERTLETWQALVHPDDWPEVSAYFTETVLKAGSEFDREYRIIRPNDGGCRWVKAMGSVDRDAQGQPQRLHGTFQDITAQKLSQAEIAETSSKLRATLNALPDLLFEVGKDGRIYQYHSHRSDLLAAPPEVFLGRRFGEILPAEATRVCHDAIEEAHSRGYSSGQRYCLELPQGARWFELSVAPMEEDGVASDRFILISRDVTDRYHAEKQLELAGLVFDHAREGIMVTDDRGSLLDVNDAFTRITGYSRDEVLGKNPRMLSSGRQSKEFYAALWSRLHEVGFWTGEVWNRRKDGQVYAELLTISAVRNAAGEIRQFVALFSDITALKNYQEELEHIAHFDVLTGLPNRLLLADRLQQAIAQSSRRTSKVFIAYMDLDDFKRINDAHGPAMGDKLLVALSHRLQALLRHGDSLARLGGDEFVIILTDFDTVEPVLPLITRLIAAAAETYNIEDLELQVSASVGVTVFPQDATMDADQLLRQADQAMYQAKLAGKNRYHIFDTQHDHEVRSHFDLLERLRVALTRREFVLHFQPKVNMRSGQVIGAEALIRWQHPERGLLPPAAFLGYLEGHPLSVEVGEWVIQAALRQHEMWLAAGLQIPVSVNIGALQLQMPDFAARLAAILQGHPQVDPKHLQLEILETSALQDMQLAIATILACKAMGVDFALDDFGTGYSSLTYLRELPVAVLKIDQSFVRNVLENAEDQAILRGVIGLAAAFGREVIAEGVETEAHGTLLLDLGCEAAQGYGIARPMPGPALAEWAAQWRPNPDWQTARRT